MPNGIDVRQTDISTTARDRATTEVELLEAFGLSVDGKSLTVPPSAQRLVAFLALAGGARLRSHVAGVLWPDVVEEQAASALRSALWRLRQVCTEIVDVSSTQLMLSPSVIVDAHQLADVARRLTREDSEFVRRELESTDLFGRLLPGWYDDWVVLAREQLHQLQLHGLEALARRRLAVGSHGTAVEAALAAVHLDPLRESPYRVLVAIHLDEGNVGEALRCFREFRELVIRELAVEPSERMLGLVSRYVPAPRRRDVSPTRR